MTNIVEKFDPATGGRTLSVNMVGMSKAQALKTIEALVRRHLENLGEEQEVRAKDDLGYTDEELGWVRERLAKATESAVTEMVAKAASFIDSEARP